ncbi:Transcription factor [Dirofilaria immitis]
MQFCNGSRMVKPTVQRAKHISVFQDPRYSSMSQRFDENLSTLKGINSKVNRHVGDTRKRKALKVRNVLVEGVRRADLIKSEQNEKLLRSVDEGQKRNKIEIGWARNTSKDLDGKNLDRNGFKFKRNKNSIDYGKPNGNKSDIKWIEGDLRSWKFDENSSKGKARWDGNFRTSQRDYRKKNERGRKIKWEGGGTLRGQNDGQEADENRSEIKWSGNSLANQNNYKKQDGSGDEIEWYGNRIGSQSDNEKPGGSEDETAWNEDILRDSNDIEKPGGNENKIKRNGNDLIHQNGGEESDGSGGDVECSENAFGIQNRSEELDENMGEIEWNGNELINKNAAEKQNVNAEWNEQNKDGAKHQKCEEEQNSGFPRKTKTLGLLCRKFFLKVLEYVNSGDDKINLESIACSMEVEKRRIYDVVNVMEALGAMEKSHKSFYTWKGLDSLPSTLHTLKIEAEKEGIHEKVMLTQHIMTQFMEIPNKSETVNVLDYQAYPDEAGPSRVPDRKIIPTAEQLNSLRNKDTSVLSKQFNLKKKESKRQRGLNSLTYLCKYFFKILIVGLDYQPDYKVSLDVASTILINDPEIDGCKPPDRSRCRRIYDVANVLISLRLIERKMFTFGTKKIPLFMYCGPNIIENGKFDFFHHIRFNKLSIKLKNSEEKKAYEMEEENLEIFFLKQEEKKKTESSAEFSGPAEKRSRIEETDLIQGNIDLGKENIPSSLINHPIAKKPTSVSIIRPQPQKFAGLRAVPFSQTSSSFNVLQSVLQQPRFPRFMPLPVCAERFLSFDTNLILLNNGDMLHNVSATRIPVQQNFNYLNTHPLSSMSFFQQPRGPIIDVANTSSTAYNNSNSSFISPRNTLRSSPFNIDAILGNRGNS